MKIDVNKFYFNKWMTVAALSAMLGMTGCKSGLHLDEIIHISTVDPQQVIMLHEQANKLMDLGKYADALYIAKKEVVLAENAYGAHGLGMVASLSQLARLQSMLGEYAIAEPLFERAVALAERKSVASNSSLEVYESLIGLAEMYQIQDRLEQAEPLLRRAKLISENLWGDDSIGSVPPLIMLASIYTQQGKIDKARELGRRSLVIVKKSYNSDAETMKSEILYQLGSLYIAQNLLTEAESFIKESLKITEKKFGANHPDTGSTLTFLAKVYRLQGRYREAEKMLQRAIKIFEKELGSDHQDTVAALKDLSAIYAAMGDLQRAYALDADSFRRENGILERVMWGAGEGTRQLYAKRYSGNYHLSLLSKINSNAAARDALFYSLSRKGLLLRIATEVKAVTRSVQNPELKEKAETLDAKKKELAQLAFSRLAKLKDTKELSKEIYDLESELGRKVQLMGRSNRVVDPDQVISALQSDQVLVDFLVYKELDLKTQKIQESQIIAVVTDPTAKPSIRLVKLGAMDPVSEKVKAYRTAMEKSDANKSMDTLAKQLYASLWKPLQPMLKGKRTVYLVPDGTLHLLPFKAMMDEQGQYLGQSMRIVTLSSARDVVLSSLTGKATDPVIVAAPDYNQGLKAEEASSQRGTQTNGIQLTEIHFAPLPGAMKEGEAVAEKMRQKYAKPVLVTGDKATEKFVSEVQAPRILHLATHGFFLDTQVNASEASERNRGVMLGTVPAKKEEKQASIAETKAKKTLLVADSMNRAGLAFAGANAGLKGVKNSDGTDGILTAGKALTLNLEGTDLVILSACQTGVGDVRNGEGVYGLQRSFQEAGAKAVLSTLWSISDEGTMTFMQSFYNRFLSGISPQQALQETQDEFIHIEKWKHPFYWAPFVMVGKDQKG